MSLGAMSALVCRLDRVARRVWVDIEIFRAAVHALELVGELVNHFSHQRRLC